MIRIVRLLSVRKVLKEFADEVFSSEVSGVIRMLRVFLLTLMIAHVGACFFHMFGNYFAMHDNNGWLNINPENQQYFL